MSLSIENLIPKTSFQKGEEISLLIEKRQFSEVLKALFADAGDLYLVEGKFTSTGEPKLYVCTRNVYTFTGSTPGRTYGEQSISFHAICTVRVRGAFWNKPYRMTLSGDMFVKDFYVGAGEVAKITPINEKAVFDFPEILYRFIS